MSDSAEVTVALTWTPEAVAAWRCERMNFGDRFPWDGPARGTTAGDALFRLCNGFVSRKQAGQSLNDRLDVLRRFAMAGERPATVPHAKVRVPRYRRRIDSDQLAVFPIDGGRRKASYILEKMKEELEDEGKPPSTAPPLPRAVMDSKEKQRLQTIFEWSGFDGKPEDFAPRIAPASRAIKGSRQEKEQLMTTISKEIDERETFLKEMEKFGRDKNYRGQIRWEIQDRLNQMKQLDRLLAEEDATIAAKKIFQEQREQHSSKKSIQWRR